MRKACKRATKPNAGKRGGFDGVLRARVAPWMQLGFDSLALARGEPSAVLLREAARLYLAKHGIAGPIPK